MDVIEKLKKMAIREKDKTFRQLLPLGLVADANSLMTGNYVTTPGRDTRLDAEIIRDLGHQATREPFPVCSCMSGKKGRCRS